MLEEKKKSWWFKEIASREDALHTIKDSSGAFLFLAAVLGGIGYFLMPSMVTDAVIFAGLAAFLRWFKSRIAACLLMVMALAATIATVLALLGIVEEGGA